LEAQRSAPVRLSHPQLAFQQQAQHAWILRHPEPVALYFDPPVMNRWWKSRPEHLSPVPTSLSRFIISEKNNASDNQDNQTK